MAMRRINGSVINWKELYHRVPANQTDQLIKFHEKSSNYLKNVKQLPEAAPTIDWERYIKILGPTMSSFVADFRCKYETLDVPYPTDSYTSIVECQEYNVKEEIEAFKTTSNDRIKKMMDDMKKISNLIPYEEMTMENFMNLCPDLAPDFQNNPTFWPHTKDEQPVKCKSNTD